MGSRRVVVTGLGALTPIGNDVNSFWDGLVSGKAELRQLHCLMLPYLKHNSHVK